MPTQVAPSPEVVGSIAGFQNFGSQRGGSYLGPLVFAGASCIISALIYGLCVRIEPVRTFEESM
ncbi:hypothetical protein BJF90_43455 [Pseudonocardia sp. CNS-004]|nr:hypothetical protein BJF90_43455 [Pseudonocardia sp. CNS-004]